MKIALILSAAALALTACATTPAQTAFDPSASSFTGYVRFTEGEFQLYAREAQVRAPFSRPCVSGALPRNAQRSAASDTGGQKVTFTGRAAPWPQGQAGLDHQGSNIRNTCGGDFVILAETISIIR